MSLAPFDYCNLYVHTLPILPLNLLYMYIYNALYTFRGIYIYSDVCRLMIWPKVFIMWRRGFLLVVLNYVYDFFGFETKKNNIPFVLGSRTIALWLMSAVVFPVVQQRLTFALYIRPFIFVLLFFSHSYISFMVVLPLIPSAVQSPTSSCGRQSQQHCRPVRKVTVPPTTSGRNEFDTTPWNKKQ